MNLNFFDYVKRFWAAFCFQFWEMPLQKAGKEFGRKIIAAAN